MQYGDWKRLKYSRHCLLCQPFEFFCSRPLCIHFSQFVDVYVYRKQVFWAVKLRASCTNASVMSMLNSAEALHTHTHTHTHTRLMALCPTLPEWAGTRKLKLIWILLKQETVSGSGICWVICKSAPCSRPITTPAPHHSGFYGLDALSAAQPTASKRWSIISA